MHKVKIEIETKMESDSTTAKNEGESKINVKKVYQFTQTLEAFIDAVEQTSDKCLDFWRELLKRTDFNSNSFH